MAELLIVLMMAFNLWMVIYLTWERREENVPKEDKEKDVGAPERSGDIMGKSLFQIVHLGSVRLRVAIPLLFHSRIEKSHLVFVF